MEKGGLKNGKQVESTNLWKKNLRIVKRVDWGDVDNATIARAIRACSKAGAALMFSTTTDGGAFSVLVLYQNDKIKEYPNSAEQAEQLLDSIAEEFNSIAP